MGGFFFVRLFVCWLLFSKFAESRERSPARFQHSSFLRPFASQACEQGLLTSLAMGVTDSLIRSLRVSLCLFSPLLLTPSSASLLEGRPSSHFPLCIYKEVYIFQVTEYLRPAYFIETPQYLIFPALPVASGRQNAKLLHSLPGRFALASPSCP